MFLRLDLHVHSFHSVDSVNLFGEINQRCHTTGLDGYALCDHDSLKGLEEAREKAADLVVIPGVEVTARGAHVLCLDPNEIVSSGLSVAETVEKIRAQGATSILAHPFRISTNLLRYKDAEAIGFDAIEVANAAQFPFRMAMELNRGMARRLGLPQTGGSDSHIPETIGRSITVVESESKDIEDVIAAIKKGKTEVMGSGIGVMERIRKTWRFLNKH
jgi:predicted metal-dependent phosphoesterase TrpH